ncbi:hypothetical protein C8J57DRAFT_1535471, partial [Mycena rebaudengoi]
MPIPKATPPTKALEWADLPSSCPAALCDDFLPAEPVPALLSLFTIDYKLDRFARAKDKSGYTTAIQSKRCGYFGPQGEFVIYSCLMKLLAEVEFGDSQDLDHSLCSTIHLIVSEDSRYECDVTSSFLTVDDFTRFILVPFTAILLITEDLSFDDFQSALFERNASNEFGDLFHPEDNNNDI